MRPQGAAPPPLSAQARSEIERWWDSLPKMEHFPYDRGRAKVLIIEFADFQCPHCRQMYFTLKPTLDRYEQQYPKDVTFMFKSWPLSKKCNPAVTVEKFTATCEAASAYIQARAKGTAEALKDWFFRHQEELTPDTVKAAAKDVGKITDFDAQFPKTMGEIRTDAALGSSIGVDMTPVFFINGRRLPGGGMTAVQYFDALIQLELSRAK